MDTPAPRLWDRRTCAQAFLALAIASAITVSVCAFKGELNQSSQPASQSATQGHTTTCTAPKG